MKYLSVGTKHIYPELFLDIENGIKTLKPLGGLWATEQGSNLKYNQWLDYISGNSYLLYCLYYKYTMEIPAMLITLKDEAKIFNLRTKQDLDYLKEKYPNTSGWINFQALTKDYDGIFIKVFTHENDSDPDFLSFKKSLSIDTLILFNPYCIEYYQPGNIEFETDDLLQTNYYRIHIKDEHKIIEENPKLRILIETIKEHLEKNNVPSTDEDISEFINTKLKLLLDDAHQNLAPEIRTDILEQLLVRNLSSKKSI